MDLVSLLVALFVVGLIVYVVTLLPIDATIRKIIQAVAIVAVVIWLLQRFLPAIL